jgi:hypothetical protein
MALLTPEATQNAKPFINALWTILVVCIMVTLGCVYILKGFPPYIAWLKPISNFVIVAGLIGVGLIVADRNKLVK